MHNSRYPPYHRIFSQIHTSQHIWPAGRSSISRKSRMEKILNAVNSFHVSLPTARLSSQALICLNTYTSATKGPDGGKEGSAMGEAEDLARRAFSRLGA